jgi:hypothetical protein
MTTIRCALLAAAILSTGVAAASVPKVAPPGDAGGITLAELFSDPTQIAARVEQTLERPECVVREFDADGRVGCNAAALYETALLIEYCGRRGVPPGLLFPRRLQGWGSTDMDVWRFAERQQLLEQRQNAFVRARCKPLHATLLDLPRLMDRPREGRDAVSQLRSNVPFFRLHAAMLGETRALRWIVRDWREIEGQYREGYIEFETVEAAVESLNERMPVEWHRLSHQVEAYRPPNLSWLSLRDEQDESRLVEAAAHLLVWRRIAEPFFDQPADLRWMHLKEHHFLRRLTENQMSLAIHRANEMLAGRPIEPRRSAGERATPPGLRSP